MARCFRCLALSAAAVPLFGHDATVGPAVGNGPRATAATAASAPAVRRVASVEATMTATIEQQGRAKVDELVRHLQAAQHPTQRQALGRQIAECKLDTDLQVLRYRSAFARGAGDLASAQRYESAVDALLHPVIRAAVSAATKKGG